jgi:hypothetical protein
MGLGANGDEGDVRDGQFARPQRQTEPAVSGAHWFRLRGLGLEYSILLCYSRDAVSRTGSGGVQTLKEAYLRKCAATRPRAVAQCDSFWHLRATAAT